jgi:hypothetical protein
MERINELIKDYIFFVCYELLIEKKINRNMDWYINFDDYLTLEEKTIDLFYYTDNCYSFLKYCKDLQIDYNDLMNSNYTNLKMLNFIIQYWEKQFHTNVFENDENMSNEVILNYYCFTYTNTNEDLKTEIKKYFSNYQSYMMK